MYQSPIERACEIVGGQFALAWLLGITPAAVNHWCKGRRPVPAERCPDIESLTFGGVRCEELRPDVNWRVLRTASPAAALATEAELEIA